MVQFVIYKVVDSVETSDYQTSVKLAAFVTVEDRTAELLEHNMLAILIMDTETQDAHEESNEPSRRHLIYFP